MLEPKNLDTPIQRQLVEPDKRDCRPTLRPHLTRAGLQCDCQETNPGRCEQSKNGQIYSLSNGTVTRCQRIQRRDLLKNGSGRPPTGTAIALWRDGTGYQADL